MTQGSTDESSHVTAASPAPAPDAGCRAEKGDFHPISIQAARAPASPPHRRLTAETAGNVYLRLARLTPGAAGEACWKETCADYSRASFRFLTHLAEPRASHPGTLQ